MSRPRVQHVSIPRPPGSADRARAFYGDLLGLPEVVPPRALSHMDLVWYQLGDTEIHLFAEELRNDTSGRHLCIEFDDLDRLRARLAAAGYTPADSDPIPGRPRFFCNDPFGNRIECTTITGNYAELERSSDA
jgi:catechol 2,3-dioxygenase-like lactoylglutathione lyase family enzyme